MSNCTELTLDEFRDIRTLVRECYKQIRGVNPQKVIIKRLIKDMPDYILKDLLEWGIPGNTSVADLCAYILYSPY